MALKKNQYIEMEFTGMTAEGAAVGRHQGEAVFVPLGAPGDRALVKIVKAAKTHAFGRLERVLEGAGLPGVQALRGLLLQAYHL